MKGTCPSSQPLWVQNRDLHLSLIPRVYSWCSRSTHMLHTCLRCHAWCLLQCGETKTIAPSFRCDNRGPKRIGHYKEVKHGITTPSFDSTPSALSSTSGRQGPWQYLLRNPFTHRFGKTGVARGELRHWGLSRLWEYLHISSKGGRNWWEPQPHVIYESQEGEGKTPSSRPLAKKL